MTTHVQINVQLVRVASAFPWRWIPVRVTTHNPRGLVLNPTGIWQTWVALRGKFDLYGSNEASKVKKASLKWAL